MFKHDKSSFLIECSGLYYINKDVKLLIFGLRVEIASLSPKTKYEANPLVARVRVHRLLASLPEDPACGTLS